MDYISQITIIRNVNGKTKTETIRKEFNRGSTMENRRDAIRYLQDLEHSFQLAQQKGVEQFSTREEVVDFANFNTLIKSLTCIHSTGTVELINNQFMDEHDITPITMEALTMEFDGFCREIINTGESMPSNVAELKIDGKKVFFFADDLQWILAVNKSNAA